MKGIIVAMVAFVVISACALISPVGEPPQSSNDGFSFTPPSGYEVKEFQGLNDSWMEAENLLFAQKKPVYFVIYRRDLSAGGSLDEVFEQHLAKEEPQANHFQMLSLKDVQVFNRRAIEYTFAHFHGEPYVRTRETWLEHGGKIYILACSQTINANEASGPVSEECGRLLEAVQFK